MLFHCDTGRQINCHCSCPCCCNNTWSLLYRRWWILYHMTMKGGLQEDIQMIKFRFTTRWVRDRNHASLLVITKALIKTNEQKKRSEFRKYMIFIFFQEHLILLKKFKEMSFYSYRHQHRRKVCLFAEQKPIIQEIICVGQTDNRHPGAVFLVTEQEFKESFFSNIVEKMNRNFQEGTSFQTNFSAIGRSQWLLSYLYLWDIVFWRFEFGA